ncbi:MAG: glycogen/starch/alpha-glucan phosphorylase [Firmicutes bacterium]|nr:glycogen/starch/alpha-glucan phosphorylase [Bacillota bacterium]
MTKKELKEQIQGKLKRHYGVDETEAKPQMIYDACAQTVRDLLMDKWVHTKHTVHKKEAKQLYYLSIEFLLGRSLRNNVFNLGLMSQFQGALKDMGTSFDEICDIEQDAALGNGGLGRLAACYMDAISSQGLPATGFSILYEYGLFKQRIIEGQQTELPDSWLDTGRSWLVTKEDEAVEVRFGGHVEEEWTENGMKVHLVDCDVVRAVPNDMLMSGYRSKTVNALRLWQPKSVYNMNMSLFNAGDYLKAMEHAVTAEVLSKVLYPEDNTYEGKSLRIKQQYFFISASVQTIIRKHLEHYPSLDNLADKIVIQINDTHPAMVIPEMMRILMDEHGLSWDKAWDLTSHSVAYTNHTVMVEALERWPEELIQKIVPRIHQIILEINRRFCEHLWQVFPGDWDKISYMSIVGNGEIRMAHLSIAGSFSVNGVSALHSQILKDDCFHDFYLDAPEKFTNVTNGIAYRRWLGQGNPGLAKLLKESIGDSYLKKPNDLEKLKDFADDPEFLTRFDQVKRENKLRLAEFIKKENGIVIDPDSIFDVQAKRLHEYKRQLLNVLHILRMYYEIKDDPNKTVVPRTFLFGAKAAPGYSRAKEIIRLIHAVADMVNNDPAMDGKLKVVFIQDYKVTVAEILMPAANLSEQISTAGREASGTGNMKFMLNGAVTIGTYDGANIEILDRVGEENFFLFGLRTADVNHLLRHGYDAMSYYVNNPWINRVVSAIQRGIGAPGREIAFPGIANSLLFNNTGNVADPYLVLADFEDYCRAQNFASEVFTDKMAWNRKALINVAMSGDFAADRSVLDYDRDIWHLTHLPK